MKFFLAQHRGLPNTLRCRKLAGFIALTALACSTLPVLALAQTRTWPERPIRLIVPYPAGGGVDIVARAVSGSLGERLGQAAKGARGHWGIESMHWMLDCVFGDDRSRYRTGYGAKNMAVVRRFALGLVRANKAKGSVKTRRKIASWDKGFLKEVLQLKSR